MAGAQGGPARALRGKHTARWRGAAREAASNGAHGRPRRPPCKKLLAGLSDTLTLGKPARELAWCVCFLYSILLVSRLSTMSAAHLWTPRTARPRSHRHRWHHPHCGEATPLMRAPRCPPPPPRRTRRRSCVQRCRPSWTSTQKRWPRALCASEPTQQFLRVTRRRADCSCKPSHRV